MTAQPTGEFPQRCPWCCSTQPEWTLPRFLGIRCASAWHSDHPEHGRFVARYVKGGEWCGESFTPTVHRVLVVETEPETCPAGGGAGHQSRRRDNA